MAESRDVTEIEQIALDAFNAQQLHSIQNTFSQQPRVGKVPDFSQEDYHGIMGDAMFSYIETHFRFEVNGDLLEDIDPLEYAKYVKRVESLVEILGVSEIKITNVFQILGILRDGYTKLTNEHAREDLAIVYELLCASTDFEIDNGRLLLQMLIQNWDIKHCMTAFIRILMDNDIARRQFNIIESAVSPKLRKLWLCAKQEGIPLEDVSYDRILFVRKFAYIDKNVHDGEFLSGSVAGGYNHDPRFMVDLNHHNLRFILNVGSISAREEVTAKDFACTILHESLHHPRRILKELYGRYMEYIDASRGSASSIARELVTDAATEFIALEAGVILPEDIVNLISGYRAERLLTRAFIDFGIITLSEIKQYGYNQDEVNFMTRVDNGLLGLTSITKGMFLDELFKEGLLNEAQYMTFNALPLLTCKMLVLALHA